MWTGQFWLFIRLKLIGKVIKTEYTKNKNRIISDRPSQQNCCLAEMNELDGLRMGDAERRQIYHHCMAKTGSLEVPLLSLEWGLCCHCDIGSE